MILSVCLPLMFAWRMDRGVSRTDVGDRDEAMGCLGVQWQWAAQADGIGMRGR